MTSSRVSAAAALAVMLSCSNQLPPLAEVVVVVDTDVAVPQVASVLRVDVFAEDGTWLSSRDVARPDPRDFPVSFGVATGRGESATSGWLRLRLYPGGYVEDYRGEAPVDWGGAIVSPVPASSAPRLVVDGVDRTPASAPERLVSIDRLVHLSLAKDKLQVANIFLSGNCIGTQAHFGDDPTRPTLGTATTCIDSEKQRVPVTDAPLSDAGAQNAPSKVGTWLFEECPAPSSTRTRVCVPGGATLIGSDDEELNQYQRTVPSRVFGLHRFFIDRDEITVGVYRDALRRGLVTENPTTNNGPLGPTSYCTRSKDPVGREDFPLNCITRTAALDYCHFQGGDLPTEVQWEHVATLAGRTAKAPYPWGSEESFGCNDLVYARYAGATCASAGLGPVSTSDPSALDVTPLGVRRLGGSLSEWVKDDAADFRDACWGDAPLVDPSCQKSGALLSARGMGWEFPVAHSVVRFDAVAGKQPEAFGFRCVYMQDAP